jgi:hypothetical protein
MLLFVVLISAQGCSLSAGRAVSLLALCAIRSLNGVSVLLRLHVNSDEVYSSSHALREEYSGSWHAHPAESRTLRSNQLFKEVYSTK